MHMSETPPPDVAQRLGNLAINLQHHTSFQDTLQAIVEGAVHLVPGARWAGISLIRGKTLTPEVPTDPLVADLDALQSSLDVGPGLSAARDKHAISIDDTATDTRWPRFTLAAHERGVHSVMSFPLFVRRENLGALNLYSDHRAAFTDQSQRVGTALAQHASIAMIGAAARMHFETALASRDIIGQAKGVLMDREKLTSVQAFTLLATMSQDANTKLRDIARRLVEQHEAELPHTKLPPSA